MLRERGDDARALTRRQQLIWIEEHLNPGVPANNMAMTFRIEGDLDPERFRRAFASVAAESDALRTVFHEDAEGVPHQRTVAEVPGQLEICDLRGEPEGALERWVERRCSRPHDLSACAWDTALLRTGERCWVWYLGQHHIVTDGTSFSLLYRRVAERYANPQAPPPAAASFADHCVAERRYRSSERAARAEAYWRDRESQPLEPLRLHGAAASERRAHTTRLSLALGPERSAALRSLAARPDLRALNPELSVSLLFTTVLLAYLHRVTGNRRIGLGMPVRNRRTRAFRETLGLLMEMLAIRVEVHPDDRFADLLARARQELQTALRHAAHGVRNPAHARRFEVMLNFHNAHFPPFCGMPTRAESFTGLGSPRSLQLPGAETWPGGEDLALQIQDFAGSGAWTLDFDLNADVFAGELGERAVGHFERLLDALLEDPATRLADVDIVGDEERASLLHGFQREAERPATSVVQRLEDSWRRHADRTALRFGDATQSYAGLEERSASLAAHLLDAGVARGDRVAVLLERSLDLPAVLLGILRAGAAYVPLDPDHPPARNRLIAEDARPALLLTQASLTGALEPEGARILRLEDLDAPAPRRPLPAPEPDDLAYVLFTSGSTGRPKGCEITHRGLLNFLEAMLEAPGLGPDDVVVSVTTVAFDILGLDLYASWLAGAEVVMAEAETPRDPARLARLLDAVGATLLQATPATWRMLLDDGWRGRRGLRVLTGGEALSRELADALLDRCAEVWNLYGPTETTVWSTLERVLPGEDPVSVGRPIPNQRVYVLDAQRRPVPLGVTGELWIAGAGVGRGYASRPELTRECFTADPFVDEPGARMYRTGDLGRRRPDGRLDYVGRRDHQVKIRGFRVELAEVERCLDVEPTLGQRAVLAWPDGRGGLRLVAYLSGANGGAPDLARLRAGLRERLPAYMIPARFVVLDALPLTPTGKIDRDRLPDPGAEACEPDEEYVAPAGPIETAIADMWRDVLGVESVGAHQSFFDLGGHSLAALDLFRRLRREFGVDMPLAALFHAPTVRRIAALVERRRAGDAGAAWTTLVPIQPEGSRMPLFCAAGVGGHAHNLGLLAKWLGSDQPFYGIQAPGVVGHELVHGRVEDIARESLGDLRSFQPHGPYLLGGYSAGGVVAFEMAQQLLREGEEVVRLILLDSLSPAIPRRSPAERLRIHLRRLREEGLAYPAVKALDRLRGDWGRARMAGVRLRARLWPGRYAHERFLLERLDVQRRYRARAYQGDVTLFRIDRPVDGYHTRLAMDATNGWAPLVEGELEVIEVPGGHMDMCEEPNVGVLARRLRAVLDRCNDPSGPGGG